MFQKQRVEVARKVIYGSDATPRLPFACESYGLDTLLLVSGSSSTAQIVKKNILPLMINQTCETVAIRNGNLVENIEILKETVNQLSPDAIVAVGGGKVMDIVKVVSAITMVPWISFPTSASHDGFSSPYINYILREMLKEENFEIPVLRPPIIIIGDTTLISKAPKQHIISGVGDLIAKFTAVKDWELAHRLRGEHFDEYAATFGLLSARVVEEGYPIIAQRKEPGVRLIVKALGNSGVAMSIAGNSRPGSGSEHLISHYLDFLAMKNESIINSLHGYQVGVATIFCSYLQGGDWKLLQHILKQVDHPITLEELKIDKETFLNAIINAHTIRPDRYTILGNGLSKFAALKAMEETGIIG